MDFEGDVGGNFDGSTGNGLVGNLEVPNGGLVGSKERDNLFSMLK